MEANTTSVQTHSHEPTVEPSRSNSVLRTTWRFLITHNLLWLGLLIHLTFYLSIVQTHWWNYFFSGSVLHLCCRGLDFYQIPNGAYAFFHGGPLNVTATPGTTIWGVGFPASNPNVYHPLFTIILGGILIQFSPTASFFAWMWMKLFITIVVYTYFFIRFKDHKYIRLALFLALINSTQYIDLEISQFQFALNIFLFLLLIQLAQNERSPWAGIWYFLCLIVKPIGLLWIPVLLFKRQYTTLLLGLGLFALATLLFLIDKSGNYYIDNLQANFFTPNKSGPIQIITLDALLRYSTPLPDMALTIIKLSFLALVVCLSAFKRIHLLTGIFLAIAYYLLFYDLVFEYHYTTLIPILAICLVTRPEFQTLPARILLVIISLPNAMFLLRFFQVDMKFDPFLGPDPTFQGWQLIVLSRIVPLILLVIAVLVPQIKPIFIGTRDFLKAMYKTNKELNVFG